MTAVPDPALLPVGSGELAALTRDRAWGETPLGPIEQWPQSLRTLVDFLLTSRFSMWMGWGPELTMFYNDAYRRDTLGVKHPWALGQPARAVWSEIWGDLEPRVRVVMETGEATWDEGLRLFLERSGFPEETYHTFSYSPIRDESGTIAGLFCVVTEVTDKVIGERRLALLRELAAQLAATTREAEVYGAVARALGGDAEDLPFAMVYLYEEVGSRAKLVCTAGIEAGHAAAPMSIDVADAGVAIWPAEAMRRGEALMVIDGLEERFRELPTGAWDRPPSRAALVPIMQHGQEAAAGFMVVGLSPYRAFDAAYEGFVRLVAGQTASGIANARVYEEERRRAEALAELDRAKTTFFSNVSHELRTPLTLLLGPLEDALRDGRLEEELREELDLAHRNALRLLKLVNSLLDFSRIEAGRIEAVYEPTDLLTATAELTSSFRSACERAGLWLRVEGEPLREPVHVDRDLWEKVVLNLVSNAFKHTFTGGITVRVGERDGSAMVEVEDTGVGIPAAQLPRVFERFHRVPNARSRTHEGTGIGLALVQEIVRRHGGRIEVTSEEGVGTRFSVVLPFGSQHLPREQVGTRPTGARRATSTGALAWVGEALRWLPAEGVEPGSDRGGDGAGTDQGQIRDRSESDPAHPLDRPSRILLADDNADMRDYVTRLLRDAGWEVTAVGDGVSALEAARRDRPELVLSDVMMPGLDGFALLRALRAEESMATTPVILLSARAGEEARVEGAQAGADDYLVKPFSAQELVARVGAHLSLARERARATAAVAAARDHLTRIFEQAPVGICVLRGPELVFELANANYGRFLPPDRPVIGRPLREVVPEAESQGFVELLEGVLRSGRPYIGRAVELHYDRRGVGEAESAYFNLLYHPLADLDGTISGVIAVVSEVTDEVRARREAETARVEAEEARRSAEAANRAKSDFLAVMSHELRTPLNAIGGYVDLISLGIHGPVSDAQQEALVRIGRSQRHLLALINDVLNLARIETGRVDYTIERVPVETIVRELGPMIEPQLASTGLRYDVHEGDALVVLADREKVAQILLNLLSNAMKFTPMGGRIALDAARDGDVVSIRVADSGIGIPAGKLEAIFEPFVQVRTGPTRSADGAGLGLAISRDLARGMGGDLQVESSVGQGSTFTLTLPFAR